MLRHALGLNELLDRKTTTQRKGTRMNSDYLNGYGQVGTNGPQRDKSPCEVAACLANEQADRLFDRRITPAIRGEPLAASPARRANLDGLVINQRFL
jgi:hypothetical protein